MDDAAYRKWRRWKECGQKVRYLNAETARKNATSSKHEYECPWCGFWHTGAKGSVRRSSTTVVKTAAVAG